MKTHNYAIDLMTPGQANKEIVFNEAQLKMDILSNPSVIGFLDSLPPQAKLGDKYIMNTGDVKHGHICYCSDLAKGWQFLVPRSGLIQFIYQENSFMVFQEGDGWQKINFASHAEAPPMATTTAMPIEANIVKDGEKFVGINEKFIIPAEVSHLYLYVNGECMIDASRLKSRECTIIIKQNYAQSFNITWHHSVLWPSKTLPQVTQTLNAMDIIKLTRLVETPYCLGQVVGQDYQF